VAARARRLSSVSRRAAQRSSAVRHGLREVVTTLELFYLRLQSFAPDVPLLELPLPSPARHGDSAHVASPHLVAAHVRARAG